MAFTQKLFTSYHGYDNPDTRIGEINRIWYDSINNVFRIQLDDTPGGTVIGGGGGGGNYTLPVATSSVLGGVKIGSNITITSGVISVAAPFSGSYTDLTNKPSLFSGNYTDLSGLPTDLVTLDGTQTLTNKTLTSPTINDGVFQNTFTIGTQVFYTHTNGFSVNENFDITDPYGTQANFTGYHFTSGAGKDGVAFTLARTGNFTDGFGITGDAYNNNFVIGSETANTDYVFKTGIGMPFDVSGGTTIFTINRNGNLTFADTSVQTTAWLGYVTQVNSPSGGTYTALILNADGTISLPIVSSQSFSSIIDGSDNTQLTLAKFAGAYTKNAGNSNGGVWNSSGIAGSAINLFNDGHITLTTNNGAVPPAVTTYSFSNTGNFSIPASLTFPDTTVQSTAWLGSIDTIFKLNPSAGPGDNFRAGVQADLTNGVGINTSVGSGQFGTVYSWKFGFDGHMTFPDTSVQTTAYTDTRAKGLFSVTTNSASGSGSLSYSSGVFTFTPPVIPTVPTYSITTNSASGNGSLSLSGTTFTFTPASVPTSVTINGTAVTLGSSGTVTAAAGTLTGTTLNSTVVSSSLTSVGTLSSLAVTNSSSTPVTVTYTPATATGQAIFATGKDTVGGTGYFDFLRATNTTSGVSNGTKTMRLDSSGNLQILNNAYTSVVLQVSDAGQQSIAQASTTNNDPTTNWLSFNNNQTAIYDDGNTHIHNRASNQSIWINTNGGDLRLLQQSPVNGGAVGNSIIMGGSQSSSATAYLNVLGSKSYTVTSYGYLSTSGAGTGGNSGSVGFGIYCSNRIQSGEVDVTSDERLKDVQGVIPLDKALQFVRAVDGILYTWRPGFGDEGLKSGFSAQGVHKAGFDHMIGHIPNENVAGQVDEDGWTHPDKFQLTMGYNQAIPYHHEVIKHLLDRIEQLEATVAKLAK